MTDKKEARPIFIYVLSLKEHKYYVGRTKDPTNRIPCHFERKGSKWTQMYPPIKVLELIPNSEPTDEDKYTLLYMNKYGIENVRGGSFVTVKLDSSSIEILERMLKGSNERCFECGGSGHFASFCPQKSNDRFTII